MKQLEILNEIEKILKDAFNSSTTNKATNDENLIEEKSKKSRKKGPVKAIANLIISFFMSVVKAPFQLIQVYIKNEIVAVIKKEIKSYFIVILLFCVLFTILVAFWVAISLAIGVYCVNEGLSLLTSIFYVIGFQLIAFLIVGFFIFRFSRKIKSLKLLRDSK
jgi:hypothetical protein